MRNVVSLTIFGVVSLIIGYNGISEKDELTRSLKYWDNVLLSWICWVLFVIIMVFLNLSRMKTAFFVTLALSIGVAYLPYGLQKLWNNLEEDARFKREYTLQEVESNFFNSPSDWRPPMKDVKVALEKGHIILSMRYDEEKGRRIHADYNEPEFREKLLHYVEYEVSRLTDYKQFLFITRTVEFEKWQYRFERLPLKKENGKPFSSADDEQVQKMIQEKLVVEIVE